MGPRPSLSRGPLNGLAGRPGVTTRLSPPLTGLLYDLSGGPGALYRLSPCLDGAPGGAKGLIDPPCSLAAGGLYVLMGGFGAMGGLASPLDGTLKDFPGAPGAANRLSLPRAILLSGTLPAFIRPTLLPKMASALFLASGDRNPSVPNLLPSPVRSVVTGLRAPVTVLTTGSTRTTLMVRGSTKRLLTMTFLVSTMTTVVKLWQM